MGIVGASVAKGWIDSGSLNVGLRSFDIGLIRNIAMSWVITIPCALIASVCIYAPSRVLFIGPFKQ
jgi:phosphate/sulfate permease